MRPLVRVSLAAWAALAISRAAEHSLALAHPANAPRASASAAPSANDAVRAACPAGALPDHGACIPVPVEEPADDGPSLEVEENAHHDRSGRLVRYEHIPRRPERPADYRRYLLPVPLAAGQAFAGSGYDLDRPDAEQRRGSRLKAVGHGGLDLAAPRGTEVQLVSLEHQRGEAEVIYVGELFGTSVVTRHTLLEAGTPRDYLIIHGHLERANATLRPGMTLEKGALLGFVGDTGSAGIVHLHFELRRVRDGVSLRGLAARELVHNSKTIACDPRNLLELTGG